MKIEWKKLSIESTAIVTSILLAFAIEAWWSELQENEIEIRLIQGFYSDLDSDADDLLRARLTISRCLWVLDAWLAELGDISATARLGQERLDLIIRPDFSVILTTFGLVAEFDPINAPLAPFESMPDFDMRNDTYNEVVATGAMNVIQELSVRSAILAYYRQATDQGENERRAGQHHERVEEVFSWINIAIGDPSDF